MSENRSIELEVEVVGTPEEVWRAVATGPGISSWYVPHIVEEREGGTAVASFGPGPEMQIPGRVAVWDPPHRIVFDGGEGVGTMAFEWIVEPNDSGTCTVRLINSGFGEGEEQDAEFDGMTDGWQLFLLNLALHLEHFNGGSATAMLPTASWIGPREEALTRLNQALGFPSTPAVGERVEVTAEGAPPLAGTVVIATPWRLALILDQPLRGTSILAAEGKGDEVSVSIWSYLYGDEAGSIVERDTAVWQEWLSSQGGDGVVDSA